MVQVKEFEMELDEYMTDEPCSNSEAEYHKDIPNAHEEDKVGKQCDHHDNGRGTPEDNVHYMCEGVYELLTDGSCNSRYGPRECPKCKGAERQCMRVKCNKCGHIARRYIWYIRQWHTIPVEKPRRMVVWYPLG